MNPTIKKWLVDNCGVAADASEEEFKAAYKQAIADEKLSVEAIAKMAAETPDKKKELTDAITSAVTTAQAPLLDGLKELVSGLKAAPPAAPPAAMKGPDDPPADDPPAGDPPGFDMDKAIAAGIDKAMAKIQPAAPQDSLSVIAGAKGNPRVMKVTERYSDSKTAAICPKTLGTGAMPHPMAGQQALENNFGGRGLDHPSDKDLAIIGAFLKFASPIGYNGNLARMPDHERDLVLHALHEEKWAGNVGWKSENNQGTYLRDEKLAENQMKAVLDEATSGGSYAVPQVFDDSAILTPILSGEIYPLVEVVPLSSGSQVDGFKVTDVPIVSHGSGEGTAITLATTASLISNFDTSIFSCTAGIEWGRDWESDTPLDFGRLMTTRLGEKLKEWLDNQVANGDGTTEPTGIFNASGILSVAAAGGTSGPYTIGDMEDLAWKVTKAYRNSMGGNRCAFLGSDTAYKRVRAVPITSSDDRRIFGQDHKSYEVLDYPFKVQDDISNGRIAFGNFAWYRMYRRLGIRFETSNVGETLMRKNTNILIMRARFGGQPTQAAAFSKMTDGAMTG